MVRRDITPTPKRSPGFFRRFGTGLIGGILGAVLTIGILCGEWFAAFSNESNEQRFSKCWQYQSKQHEGGCEFQYHRSR